MTDDPRLPITIRSIPGGTAVELADGRRLFVYGRDPDVARVANAMTLAQAEALAKDIARALAEQWSKPESAFGA